MKVLVEINNLSTCRIREDFFIKTIKETLKRSGYDFLRAKNVSLSIALLRPAEIKKLNKAYRQKDAVTDVLSFCEYKSQVALEKVRDKTIFLGELVLCYNDIKEYARQSGKDVKQELAKVVSHGLLHLLGFRHGRSMFSLQDLVAGTVTGVVGK
jgi:probable rRNA maturation factor